MANTSDFVIYGETPSVHTLRGTILTLENAKLDAFSAGFKLAASGTNPKELRNAMRSLYMQSRECIDRSSRDGIDAAHKEETRAHVARVMGEATSALKLPPIDNIIASSTFSATEALYGGQEAYQNALDAGETELSYDDWIAVRTNDFKDNVVDWQALENKEHLLSEPIEIKDAEDVLDGRINDMSAWAAEYFGVDGENRIYHHEIGNIEIDESSLKESFSREISADKVSVLSALNKVIPMAKILHRESKSKNQRGYLLGAPLRVKGKDYIATMVIKRDLERNKLQLYQIELKEQLIAELSADQSSGHQLSADQVDNSGGELSGDDKLSAIHAIALKTLKANLDKKTLINSKTKEPSAACVKKLHQAPNTKLVANFEQYKKTLQQEISASDAARFVELAMS